MKTLLLARHAKSDWGDPSAQDHDRLLNPRGLRDAPAMAHRLRQEGVHPQHIVSSTALRARATADAYAAEAHLEVADAPSLYAATSRTILAVAATLPDEASVAMLVGHNPGMADAVADLTGRFVAFPTCAIAECVIDVDSWAELVEGTGELVSLRTPRDTA